jgi:hypothetical protein
MDGDIRLYLLFQFISEMKISFCKTRYCGINLIWVNDSCERKIELWWTECSIFFSQDNNFASGISSRTFERWNILYPQMPKMKVETVSVKIMLIFEVVNKSTLTHFILVPSFLLKCTVVTPHRCRSSWWYSYSDYDHWKIVRTITKDELG